MQNLKKPQIFPENSLKIRIALIGPDFFSYIQAIRDEFIIRNYPCRYFDERHSNSISVKIAYRLKLASILKNRRNQHLAKILEQIIADETTDVFLIDTEVITPEFVKTLRSKGIRVHIYMWDSARNKNSFLQLLPLLNSRSSFDPEDCKKYDMTYIPLFAENFFSSAFSSERGRNHEIVFLGTLHSHRAKHLSMLEQDVEQYGFTVRKLLYYHSRFLYVVKCLLQPFALKYLRFLRTQGFSKSEIAAAYFKSRGVLDIHHPGQSGLTSRTFESLRSGAWLITLNQTVLSLPDELKSRVLLLSDLSQLRNRIAEVDHELPPLSKEMDYFLSLERFVDDLLAIGDLPSRQSNQ